MFSVRNNRCTKPPRNWKPPRKNIKNRPHIDKYNWEDINFPTGLDEYKKFEKNDGDVGLNILYAPLNEKEISLVYKSKYNRKRKNQVVLLMVTDDEQQDTISP